MSALEASSAVATASAPALPPTATTRVKVCVRIRPPSGISGGNSDDFAFAVADETGSGGTAVVPLPGPEAAGGSVHSAAAAAAGRALPFSAAYGPASATTDLYAGMVRPVIEQVAAGFNGTVLAYGCVASGRSFDARFLLVTASVCVLAPPTGLRTHTPTSLSTGKLALARHLRRALKCATTMPLASCRWLCMI